MDARPGVPGQAPFTRLSLVATGQTVSNSQYRHPFSTDKEPETQKESAWAKVSGNMGTAGLQKG